MPVVDEDLREAMRNIQMQAPGQLMCKHNGLILEWCEHLQKVIQAGADASFLHPDMHIVVPIFPTAQVYAEVVIGQPFYDGPMALMHMEYTPDIGRKKEVHLGFWNPGEGMNSIRLTIIDYFKSKLDPDEDLNAPGKIKTGCPSNLHGIRESRKLTEGAGDLRWKWECLWRIVMEGCCTPCYEMSQGDPMGGLDPNDPSLQPPKKPWQS